MKLDPKDPRLTAYALGHLSDAESAEIKQALESDEAARQEVERIQKMGEFLSKELKGVPRPTPAAEDREAIEAEIAKRGASAEPGAAAELGPGARLGNCELVQGIGEGGMGTVYEAKQLGLERRVAVKVLSEKLAADQTYLERFRKEARAAAALQHPSLVEVYDIGEEQGRVFFSMQFVDGETLADRLSRDGKLPVSEALSIVGRVADALDHAWAYGGIIHRDIKPENIMLTRDGQVKLTDLGLAKSTGTDGGVTEPGTAVGTPAYMAPEQGRGAKDVDCRADIYSLGITLFHAVTGRQPFEGDTPLSVMMAHVEQSLPDPLSVDPSVPVSVCDLIRAMCAKDPSERYQSPSQLLSALTGLGRLIMPDDPVSGTQRLRVQPTVPSMEAYPGRLARKPKVAVALAVTGWLAASICLAVLGLQQLGPELEDEELKRLYDYAVHVARTEPGEFETIISNFKEVERKGRGTKYAMMAKTDRQKHEKQRDEKEAARSLQSDVERLVETDGFAKALALLKDLPEDRKRTLPSGDWRERIRYVERRAEERVQRLLAQARTLAQAGDGDAARERYELVRSFGLSEHEDAVILGLTELRELESMAQDEQLARAEALYRDAFREVKKLARSREYKRALAKCTDLAGDARYKSFKDRIAQDRSDVERCQKVFNVAMAARAARAAAGGTAGLPERTEDTAEKEEEKPAADDVAATRAAIARLSTEEVVRLASPAMAKLGAEGLLNLAVFWLFEGDREEATAALERAKEAGCDITSYQSYLRPILVVQTDPPGAKVKMEVEYETPFRLPVRDGNTYALHIEKDGHAPITQEVKVDDEGEYRVNLSLRKVVAGVGPLVRDGLVLYYSFDKPGERAEDLSGRGNHGTLHGVKWTADGKVGGAYEFDGKSAYIQRDYDERSEAFPRNTPFTVAAWFRSPASDVVAPTILTTHYAGASDGYYLVVYVRHFGGRLSWSTHPSREWTPPRELLLSKHPVNDGRWHHAAGVWTGKHRLLYVDGVLQGSARAHGPLRYLHRAPLRIGHSHNINAGEAKDAFYYFRGKIDEVMVFNRALSEDEIRTLATGRPAITRYARTERTYSLRSLLAAGFEIPKGAKDKHGNPIRQGTDEKTGLPLEIRHKQTGMHLVFIPAGEFMMGNDREAGPHADRERPAHKVRITKPFYMGKYEVTQAEWVSVMDANPSHFRGDRNPVEQVSWDDCQRLIGALNRPGPGADGPAAGPPATGPGPPVTRPPEPPQEGDEIEDIGPLPAATGPPRAGPVPTDVRARFSLPTEAQWEYACRSGTRTRFHFGNDLDHQKLGDYAWLDVNSGGKAHPVGEKKPNAWGLYDVSGNVWEWCEDWYGPYSREEVKDPSGATGGRSRAVRGGSWNYDGRGCRSAFRNEHAPALRNSGLGYRVALTIPTGVQGLPTHRGLVLWLRADRGVVKDADGLVSKWEDLSGKGNHASQPDRSRMPTLVKGERAGGPVVRFDGANDRLDIPHSDSLNLTTEMTVAAWVGPEKSEVNPDQFILGKYTWVGGKRTWVMGLNQNTRKIGFGIWGPNGRPAVDVHSTAPEAGGRYHVAGVFRPNRIILYIDGRLVGQEDSPVASLASFPSVPVQIGWLHGGKGHEFLKGTINDIRIYNRALTQAEIRAVMKAKSLRGPPIRDGLVLYYPFDKAGDHAEDRSGKGNHGNVHKAKWTPNGKIGGAYEFDGKTTYIQRDFDERSEVFPRSTPFSVAAWFRTSAPSPTEPIVLGAHYATRGDGFFLRLNPDNVPTRTTWGVCPGRTGTRSLDCNSSLLVADARWHHAVGTWDGTVARLYIDGIFRTSNEVPGPIGYRQRPPFRIGYIYTGPRSRDTNYFRGTIDEVMIFKRCLSADEIKFLASPELWGAAQRPAGAMPPAREALVLYYPFDEAGDRAEDRSGKGNHGKVHKAKWTPNGKLGGAYEFDGKTTYIQRDYDERSEVFPRNTPFSVAAWFRSSPGWPREPTVWGAHYSGVGDGHFFLVNTRGLGGRGRWVVCSGEREGEAHSRVAINDDRWHHAVGTWTGKQGLLYLDGVLQSSHRASGAIPYTHRPPFRIGHSHSAPNTRAGDYYFNGTIDEVMVFNRALSARQVRALWEWPGAGAVKKPVIEPGKGLLPTSLKAVCEVVEQPKDKYGNPVRTGRDAKTKLPLEIRHKETGMHLVFIPAGEFMMGSPDNEKDRGFRGDGREGPVHKVRLTKPFYLGKYEVAQAQWASVTDSNPSHLKGDRNPVEMVNWLDCQDFIKNLNSSLALPLGEGRGEGASRFALPTEAQWEYACRSGTQTRFCFGDDLDYRELADHAWFNANSGGRTHPVGEKKPNAWGLYDISGNVWEWCKDWYGTYSKEPVADPSGPAGGERRANRGGAWDYAPAYSRSAYRNHDLPDTKDKCVGLRIALNISAADLEDVAKQLAEIEKAEKRIEEPDAALDEAEPKALEAVDEDQPAVQEKGPGAEPEAPVGAEKAKWAATSEWADSKYGFLTLRLRSPQKSYSRGEPFILVAELRNNAKESVTVQKLFDDQYAARAGEMEITGPRGRVKYIGPELDYAPPFRTVRLRPGEKTEGWIRLRLEDHDSLNVPGTYQITYAYRSAEWRGKEEPPADHWSGAIETKALELVRIKFRLLWRESSGIPIEKVPTPEGFKVSPVQATKGIMSSLSLLREAEPYLFADTRNYYFGITRRGAKLSGPEPWHWVIDGTTGKTVHREAKKDAKPGATKDGAEAADALSQIDQILDETVGTIPALEKANPGKVYTIEWLVGRDRTVSKIMLQKFGTEPPGDIVVKDYPSLKEAILRLPKGACVCYGFADDRADLLTTQQILELHRLCRKNGLAFHLYEGG